MSNHDPRYLFIYDQYMRGGPEHKQMQAVGVGFVREAVSASADFKMVEYQSAHVAGSVSPGVMNFFHDGAHIEGELYEVSDEFLETMDILKGVGSKVFERRRNIAFDQGVLADMYLRRAIGRPVIPPVHVVYDSGKNSFKWRL